MRVLVTGANGQLGSELVDLYAARAGTTGDVVVGIDLPEVDITDKAAVAEVFTRVQPDVVINCAAWTAVDAAEEQEAEALRVNGDAPRLLALACAEHGAWLVQISTDYVFDGRSSAPYDEDAEPNPQSAYGRTKLAGEIAAQEVLPERHYIVRTAWLYGVRGANFVKTILKAQAERGTVSVVDDQVGQPTYARDLAEQIVKLVDARPPAGIFHGTNAGVTSWYGFTQEIFRTWGINETAVTATDSSAFVRPAPRPSYSVLGHRRWTEVGLEPMRPWTQALAQANRDGLQP